MKSTRRLLAIVFLGALGLFVLCSVIPWIWGLNSEVPPWDILTDASLTIALLSGFAGLIWSLIDFPALVSLAESKHQPVSASAFPNAGTLLVAIVLVGLLFIYIWALLFVLAPPDMDRTDSELLITLANPNFRELLVAFLAAGIGSTIATIYAYLRHACTLQDFDPAFIPWYFLRPLLGSLLGIVFYWLIRGGILAVLPPEQQGTPLDLDVTGLAGVSALVGLFSRQAIEKLRELFHVIFVTQGSIPSSVRRKAESDLIDRLPPELRDQIGLHLKPMPARNASTQNRKPEDLDPEER